MKVYLILLAISGICHLIHYLEIRTVIKKYGFHRVKKPCIEEKIVTSIKMLTFWVLIIPNILGFIIDLFAHEAFEEGICDSLENSEYWD